MTGLAHNKPAFWTGSSPFTAGSASASTAAKARRDWANFVTEVSARSDKERVRPSVVQHGSSTVTPSQLTGRLFAGQTEIAGSWLRWGQAATVNQLVTAYVDDSGAAHGDYFTPGGTVGYRVLVLTEWTYTGGEVVPTGRHNVVMECTSADEEAGEYEWTEVGVLGDTSGGGPVWFLLDYARLPHGAAIAANAKRGAFGGGKLADPLLLDRGTIAPLATVAVVTDVDGFGRGHRMDIDADPTENLSGVIHGAMTPGYDTDGFRLTMYTLGIDNPTDGNMANTSQYFEIHAVMASADGRELSLRVAAYRTAGTTTIKAILQVNETAADVPTGEVLDVWTSSTFTDADGAGAWAYEVQPTTGENYDVAVYCDGVLVETVTSSLFGTHMPLSAAAATGALLRADWSDVLDASFVLAGWALTGPGVHLPTLGPPGAPGWRSERTITASDDVLFTDDYLRCDTDGGAIVLDVTDFTEEGRELVIANVGTSTNDVTAGAFTVADGEVVTLRRGATGIEKIGHVA